MKTLDSHNSTHFPVMAAVASVLVITGCAGTMEHNQGMSDLRAGKNESALENLAKATKLAPTDAEYKIDFLLKRDAQVNDLLKEADDLRARGMAKDASEVLTRIIRIDPGNQRAAATLEGLKIDLRYERLLVDGENFLEEGKYEMALDRAAMVLEDFPKNRRAIKLRDAASDAKAEAQIKRDKENAARYVLDSPVSMRFSDASIRSLFEALSNSTGLNILFDKDVKQDARATLFVKDVSVSDALDLILLQNQLLKRVINGNTMMIYPATAAKQAEYEDLVIKTFQITNTDIKYLATMLKTMLKLKELSADEKTGIMVIRDTPESLRMAERLIAAHDVADPEIMLEVEVLEVSRTRESNLGIVPPTSISFSTPSGATATTGANGTTTSGSLTFGAFKALSKDDLLVSPLSTTLNFKLQDGDANLLASPRIRARNKESAKIMIGDRVPTVTNTVTPVSTGSSVVTGTVTYQDVGLKLEFKPQVYANSEVGIEISLEVSNIAQQFTDSNGSRSYQIGTRNAMTNLRLKDGETQILGGLITDNDRNTASKIPGLGHLPIIGRLFGNNDGSGSKSEIILAITPRIVRNLAVRNSDVKNIFSGTYNAPRERPILADPVGQLTISGTFGGAQAQGSPSGSITVNSAPQAKPTFGAPQQGNVNPLPAPPPMIQRPGLVGQQPYSPSQPFSAPSFK